MPQKKNPQLTQYFQKRCLALAIKAIGMSGGLTLRTIPTHLTKALWRHVLFQLFHQAGTAKQMTKASKIQEFPLSQKLHVIGGFIKTSKKVQNRRLHHNANAKRKRKSTNQKNKKRQATPTHMIFWLNHCLASQKVMCRIWGYIDQRVSLYHGLSTVLLGAEWWSFVPREIRGASRNFIILGILYPIRQEFISAIMLDN